MTVAPFPVHHETDDLDFCVRRSCKYIAKAIVLAKGSLHEYAACLNGAMRLTKQAVHPPSGSTSGR